MGFLDHVRAVQLPSPKQVLGSYKEAKTAVQRIDINTINVRFFPKNSPFFHATKGTLHHFTKVTLGTIEVPDKLGFIIQDDSIFFDKATKEEWVDIRQDYPITLSVNNGLANAIVEAIIQFPNIEEWYLPSSINKIPVKNIVIRHNKKDDQIAKNELQKSSATRSLVDWIDNLPTEVEITTKFLYDFMDIKIFEGLHEEATKGGLILVFMGFLMGALVSMGFMTYIGR